MILGQNPPKQYPPGQPPPPPDKSSYSQNLPWQNPPKQNHRTKTQARQNPR